MFAKRPLQEGCGWRCCSEELWLGRAGRGQGLLPPKAGSAVTLTSFFCSRTGVASSPDASSPHPTAFLSVSVGRGHEDPAGCRLPRAVRPPAPSCCLLGLTITRTCPGTLEQINPVRKRTLFEWSQEKAAPQKLLHGNHCQGDRALRCGALGTSIRQANLGEDAPEVPLSLCFAAPFLFFSTHCSEGSFL